MSLAAPACRSAETSGAPPIVQPGAPGQTSRVVSAEQASDLSSVRATPADVSFMQGMIAHHAQAVELVALLMERTARDDMRMLGQRIQVSQSDEIQLMEGWLQARGHPLPGPHAHHGGATMLMSGMLTPEEMKALASARGAEFDRLFLAAMIKHHEGALTMIARLFATPGAGQEPEIFAFASDVEADQRMEIDRMRAVLRTLETGKPSAGLPTTGPSQ